MWILDPLYLFFSCISKCMALGKWPRFSGLWSCHRNTKYACYREQRFFCVCVWPAQNPSCRKRGKESLASRQMPVTSALEKWRQDQGFKASLSYIVRSRLAGTTWDSIPQWPKNQGGGGRQIIKIHIFVQSPSLQYSSSPPHHCEVSGASLDKTLICLQVACSTKIPPLPGSINLSFPVPLDTLCQPRYSHDSAQSLTIALLVSHTWIINLSNQILLKSPLPLVCYLSHKGCTNTMSSACTLGQYTPQALLLLSGFSP